jgi:flavin-dependent dehydrogenase
LLVDKKRFPRSKVCGACLSAQALAELRAAGLGSLVTDFGGLPLEELRLGFRGRSTRLALADGAALSRACLDWALARAAANRGAEFLEETEAGVADVRGGLRHVRLAKDGQTAVARARVVLVAAGFGTYSRVRGACARTAIGPRSRVGAGCHVAGASDAYGTGVIHMAVGRAGYVGVVRVEDGSLNVAAAFEPGWIRRLGTLGRAAGQTLAEAGFEPISALGQARWQGTPALTRQTCPLAEERLFLLGDAAGYVEPFTGEGIGWALASARAVAPLAQSAIENWAPRLVPAWSRLYRRRIGRRQLLCRGCAIALRQPILSRLGFEFCLRAPRVIGLFIKHMNGSSFYTDRS